MCPWQLRLPPAILLIGLVCLIAVQGCAGLAVRESSSAHGFVGVGFDANILNIFSREVLKKIKNNDRLWETMVPIPVANAIKRRGLFGHADKLAGGNRPGNVST